MKKNRFIKSLSLVVILIFITLFITNNYAFAASISSNYWNLTTAGNTSSSGGRKLIIETYLDEVKVTDSNANTTLRFSNSSFFGLIKGVDPGNVTVSAKDGYDLTSLKLNNSPIINGNNDVKLSDNEEKTLRIDLKTKKYAKDYNIEYYVDSIKQNSLTETVQVKDYIIGTILDVPYKTPEQLGLPTAENMKYVLDGNSQLKITLNVSSTTNTAKIYYSRFYDVDYTVNYYVNSELHYTETKNIAEYKAGTSVSINYKTPAELGLSPNCTLKTGSPSSIIIDVNNPAANIVNREYTIPAAQYTISYYVNSVFQESEAVQTSKYDVNGNVKIVYKSAAELNLTSDYNVKGDAEKFIKLDLTNSNNNKVNIFYSNAVAAVEEPWKRTAETSNKILNIGSNFYNWNWSTVKALTLEETNQARVWDGAHDSIRYFKTYSNSNLGFEYATWKQQYNNSKDMRRFQTVITVPAGYDGNDFVRMKSVNQDSYVGINNGNIVPINDNIFVFVYPEDMKDKINDSNYLNYLAFWSGTVSQGNTDAYYPNSGATRIKGNKAIQISKSNNRTQYDLLIQTDGWYVEATVDNVGEKLSGAVSGDKYIIDIFTQDYAAGGGMDKYAFEFVKNKAPKAEDDAFITTKGETLNLSGGKGGLLQNDYIYVPEAGAKAQLIVDGQRIKKVSNKYELYDESNKLGGTITNFNEDDGSFTFTPNGDYMGVLKFEYECYQKKLGQNTVDQKLKDTAQVSMYVLSKVTATHKEAAVSGNIINNIASGVLKENDVVYGWPSDKAWNNNWVWPENASGINRPANLKSSYEVSSSNAFQNHNYIGYKTEDGTDVADKNNTSKVLSGTFSSDNKEVGFYYEKGKSNLIVECYVDGTTTLLKQEKTIYESGDKYNVTIPAIEGYNHVKTVGSLSGTMPNGGGVTVKLYYKAISYNYTVEYYFDDIKEYELTYSKEYGAKVEKYLPADEIPALKANWIDKGYEFEKDENVPLTIRTSSNVIRVYYAKKLSDLNWFYMYPNVNFDKDVYFEPKAKTSPYNEYNIIIGFDYTFGFNFDAAKDKPNIAVSPNDNLKPYMGSFKLYEGNILRATGNSFSELTETYPLIKNKNYTVIFGVNYKGSGNELTAEIKGDIDNKGNNAAIKLMPTGRKDVE